MATRNNALSEISRFWLQERYGLFIRECIPVKVPRNWSDIDFAVTSPGGPRYLLGRIPIVNAIVETKDERDFDPRGTDFTKRLLYDFSLLKNGLIDENTSCNFSMLKEQHHEKAKELFNGEDYARIFIFHALKQSEALETIISQLRDLNIHFITSSEMLQDIHDFLKSDKRTAAIRNSLVGDILDMLMAYHKWTAPNNGVSEK